MSKAIDTNLLSSSYRAKAINLAERKLLITRLADSEQANDLQLPPNCNGFGRIRHFNRGSPMGAWPANPLPIDPAARKLRVPPGDIVLAQVFQNAVCNWRCWYCFVPFNLLSANPKQSDWLTAGDLIDLYLAEKERAPMIDLSGGQPDLVPEWVPWTMEALSERGLDKTVFLWSDDNLSNDYFWRYLTADQIERIRTYPMYSKVCCFKGFDAASFAYNTGADPALFDQQFRLFQRYLELGLDLYAYVTFTSPSEDSIQTKIAAFVDRLQALHRNLPLRTVPLEIRPFSVITERNTRLSPAALLLQQTAMNAQQAAISAWQNELSRRFLPTDRARSIVDVSLVSNGRSV
ncbi:MAG: hypothetical protein H7A44_08660 [Opitutaceae bacterium]|nr:hypothetical protein [Cephaloticoccus sp.]MCP5530502.1 hypothetical protein [Opitutaceae bacterium]